MVLGKKYYFCGLMYSETVHIRRRAMVMMLLFLQLLVGIVPSFAAHRQLLLDKQSNLETSGLSLQALLTNLPVHIEIDDDGAESWHLTKHRRRTRFYLSAASPQVSTPSRIVYLDSDLAAKSIYQPVNKTGEYEKFKSFLPAYYTFLFRFTPF